MRRLAAWLSRVQQSGVRELFLSFRFVVLVLGLCAWGHTARADRIHRVAPGQTLSHIARRYKVSISDLRAHNRMRKGASLRVGQVLHVPPRGMVYVRPGQTLSHVARKNHCTIAALARANHMRPQAPLKAGQRLLLPGFKPPRAKDWGKSEEPGVVRLLGDEGVQRVPLVDDQGRVSRRGLMALAAVLGDDTARARRQAHPRLALLLSRVSDHFGGRPIRIVSGFREPGRYTKTTSRHVTGRAADIQVSGVPRRMVWEFCRRLKGAGCGFYPNSTFTHVDARHARAQWVDWSGPGRRPRYGTLRGPTRGKRRKRMPYPSVDGEIPLSVTVVEDAYVALAEGGRPLEDLSVTVVDDSAPDSGDDRDIEELVNPAWARVACLAEAHAWVPFAPSRVPAPE